MVAGRAGSGRGGAVVRAVIAAGLFAAAPVLGASGLAAQERAVASPVLTINQEELFQNSAFGRRIEAELNAASAALAAENRRIEAELADEEQALTDRRATMDPAEFRALAEAFDAKVVELRRTQDGKARDLSRRPEEARQEFFRAVVPVLTAVVRERGAMVILDTRAVLLSADAIDITAEAIARIDAALGDGGGAPPPETPPGTSPETPPESPGEATPGTAPGAAQP